MILYCLNKGQILAALMTLYQSVCIIKCKQRLKIFNIPYSTHSLLYSIH